MDFPFLGKWGMCGISDNMITIAELGAACARVILLYLRITIHGVCRGQAVTLHVRH